ncbi:zinc-dependent metalloprotease [Streptomyces rimosus]|uniref:zinc-dependent metalloprotease n=1 Tax=Streptomyces rimosus TaxID=1927 RepID=UPI0004CB402E|nr:zinc-dependent metalloprotease [Streptomyces rimosus]
MFGVLPSAARLHRSWRYRLHQQLCREQDRRAQQHTQAATEPPGPPLDPRVDGARFVAAAVAGVGDVARFNKVWHDLSLVPTDEEIHQPEAWLRRVGL